MSLPSNILKIDYEIAFLKMFINKALITVNVGLRRGHDFLISFAFLIVWPQLWFNVLIVYCFKMI